jgi:glutaryl-CoA dehydrogenase
MARGEVIGCFGLTEPDFGSNPSGMITVAREQADGSFVLDGAKMWITNGSQADVAVVWAKLVRHGETAVGDDKAIRGFIVPTTTPGFRARDQKGKLSLRASDTSELILEEVRLPADAILPGRGAQEPAHVPHAGALRHLVGRARRGDRLLRGGHALRQDARDVRQADRRLPDPAGAPGRHAHRDHQGAARVAAPRPVQGRGHFHAHDGVAGQAQQREHRHRRRARGARLLGGNGILAEYASMRHMANLESVYTYEGTHDVHSLILGQAITGLNAFK